MGADASSTSAQETNPIVALSSKAQDVLDNFKLFLRDHVFNSPRVQNRNETLKVLIRRSLDILYETPEVTLATYLPRLAAAEGWDQPEDSDRALEWIQDNAVQRVQACVSILTTMSDEDIYDLIGIS